MTSLHIYVLTAVNPFMVRIFLGILVSLLKLTVLSQIFIKFLSNHIFLESHIVTQYVGAVYFPSNEVCGCNCGFSN